MAITTRARTGRSLILTILLLASGSAGCASNLSTASTAGGGTSSASGPVEPTPSSDPAEASTAGGGTAGSPAGVRSANAELASVEFVTAALDGGDAASYLATGPVDDPQRGAPYDPVAVGARLGQLDALSAFDVSPSTTAYPDSVSGLGPACDDTAGLVCQVDLADQSGHVATTVVVHWLDDGVSDFTVVARRADGSPVSVGEARCTQGRNLVHGGHAVDRFDIALCSDASGALEYNGANRDNDQALSIEGCAVGPNRWEATNEGYTYIIDGQASPARTRLQVEDPQGEILLDTFLTAVRFPPSAELLAC